MEKSRLDFDVIIVGASPLTILEAMYLEQTGKKILIIDKDKKIGGAWSSIEIKGINDIENAIHYFLPNEKGIKFLKENLGLKIEELHKKALVIKLKNFGYLSLNPKGLFFTIISRFFKIKKQTTSFYLKNGSPDLINSILFHLKKFKLKIFLSEQINKIIFERSFVNVITNKSSYLCSQIIITNSSRLKNLIKNGNKIEVNEKIQPRPSIHFLIHDCKINFFNEFIFRNSALIKYVHNVSRFTSNLEKNNKVLIIALKHEIKFNDSIIQSVHLELINAKICSKKSKIIEYKWSDIVLPRLFDEDLIFLKNKIGKEKINYLKTENFTKAIGENYYKWNNIKLIK